MNKRAKELLDLNEDINISNEDVIEELSTEEIEYFNNMSLESISVEGLSDFLRILKDKLAEDGWIDKVEYSKLAKGFLKEDISEGKFKEIINLGEGKPDKVIDVLKKLKHNHGKTVGYAAVIAAIALSYKLYKDSRKKKEESEISKEELESDNILFEFILESISEEYSYFNDSNINPINESEIILEAIEDFENSKTNLEELLVVLEAMPEDSFTKEILPIIEMNLKQSCGKYISYNNNDIFSTESLEGMDTIKELALEDIKDKLKDYYSKLDSFINKFLNTEKHQYQEDLKIISDLRTKLKTILDNKKILDATKLINKEIKISDVCYEHLLYKGDFNYNSLETGLTELTGVIKSLSSNSVLSDTLIKQSEDIKHNLNGNLKGLTCKEVAKIIQDEAKNMSYKIDEDDYNEQKSIIMRSKSLIGNRVVSVLISGGGIFTRKEVVYVDKVNINLYQDEAYLVTVKLNIAKEIAKGALISGGIIALKEGTLGALLGRKQAKSFDGFQYNQMVDAFNKQVPINELGKIRKQINAKNMGLHRAKQGFLIGGGIAMFVALVRSVTNNVLTRPIKVTALDEHQILTLVDSTIELIDSVLNTKTVIDKRIESSKKLTDINKELFKSISYSKDSFNNKDAVNGIVNSNFKTAKALLEPNLELHKLSLNVAKSMYSYIMASIINLNLKEN